MAPKLGNKFVALCTVALGAIYTTGYVITENHDPVSAHTVPAQSGQSASTDDGGAKPQTTTDSSGNTGASASGSTTKTASTSTSGQSQSTSKQKYLDGTYTGSGANDIGTVSVAVTIKSGKISGVQITQCDTHYPEDYIAGLPQEVVALQSYNVNIVTGATKSTEDFAEAVYEALSQAQNPHYVA